MEKRVYELTVLMPDGSDEKKVESAVSELLGKGGGKILKRDFWGKKQLVYPIKKLNRAVFGHFLIEMTSKETLDLQKRIRLNDEIIRHLLVVTNQKIKEEKKTKTKAKKA